MNDPVKCVTGEEAFHTVPVCQVQADKAETVEWFEPLKTRLFQAYIIVAVQVVKADDRVPIIEKTPG